MQEKALLMTGLVCGDDLRLDADLPELLEMRYGTTNASCMRLCSLDREFRSGLRCVVGMVQRNHQSDEILIRLEWDNLWVFLKDPSDRRETHVFWR